MVRRLCFIAWSVSATWNLDAALAQAKEDADDAVIQTMVRSNPSLRGTAQTKSEELKSSDFNFYLYPPNFEQDKYLSYWFANLTAALSKSPRRTIDPTSASVFFLGIDTSCERNWPNYLGEAEENYRYGDTGWQTTFIRV